MPDIEERVAKVEGILEEVRTRLNHMENRLESNFRWLLGIQITMWVTLMVAIFVKG